MLDQSEQQFGLVFLGDELLVGVVRLGAAGVGLVEQHHVEVGLQVLHRLREGGSSGQRAIDQNDGLASFPVGVELRVDVVLVNRDDGGFRPHVVSS
ncbi:hypothetical protein D9M71_151410 [compost metagenome]